MLTKCPKSFYAEIVKSEVNDLTKDILGPSSSSSASGGGASSEPDPEKSKSEKKKCVPGTIDQAQGLGLISHISREEAQRALQEERRKEREQKEYQREKMRDNIRQKYGIEKKKDGNGKASGKPDAKTVEV